MNFKTEIYCPKCGLCAVLSIPSIKDFEIHGLEILRSVVPDGFRIVQQGWDSDVIRLFCSKCSIAVDQRAG
jgi:hypothetical protein